MKKIIVKLISIYAEKLGKERIVELEDNATIEDLEKLITKWLGEVGLTVKPVLFVNYRFPREKQFLEDGDEILVMPPFAGG